MLLYRAGLAVEAQLPRSTGFVVVELPVLEQPGPAADQADERLSLASWLLPLLAVSFVERVGRIVAAPCCLLHRSESDRLQFQEIRSGSQHTGRTLSGLLAGVAVGGMCHDPT